MIPINEIVCGDCLEVMKDWPDGSINCCISSPPYWALRDYGTGKWIGGDSECDHLGEPKRTQAGFNERYSGKPPKNTDKQSELRTPFLDECGKCGARRIDKQLGLEKTFEEYIDKLCTIYDEVKRVLRPDGTCFVNLGDTYNSTPAGNMPNWKQKGGDGCYNRLYARHTQGGGNAVTPKQIQYGNIQAKSLCLIPQRFAIEMVNRGWIARNLIIWHKPNPMPSSARDRFTVDFEDVWYFTKSNKTSYYINPRKMRSSWRQKYDYIWVHRNNGLEVDYQPFSDRLCKGKKRLWNRRNLWEGRDYWFEPQYEPHHKGTTGWEKSGRGMGKQKAWGNNPQFRKQEIEYNPLGRNKRTVWTIEDPNYFIEWLRCNQPDFLSQMYLYMKQAASQEYPSSVWTIPTQSFPEAHFACVDEETECLTINGWKKLNELKIGEPIASYNLELKRLRWSNLQETARYKVQNEKMVKLYGRGIDQLLTCNHRCVIQRKSGNELIVRADELKTSHKVLVSGLWKSEQNPFPENLSRLIGWYVTEGNAGKDCVTLYQSGDANPEYCEEIREILLREGADYIEASRKRKYKNKEVIAISWRIVGAIANILLSLCPQKHLPEGYLQWEHSSLLALWDSLMKGDGHFREGGRQTFVQKDKHLIDQVQALAFRLGYTTTLRKRSSKTWSLYKTLSQTRLLRSESSGLISKQNYTGVVWCPKTRDGTFVARRNGRVFITGNTFPEKLVEPMIKAGCPEFVCKKCGKAREKMYEKSGGTIGQSWHDHNNDIGAGIRQTSGGVPLATAKGRKEKEKSYIVKFKGYADCGCNAGWRPGIVLDMFCGQRDYLYGCRSIAA